jgi:hypothetical protein
MNNSKTEMDKQFLNGIKKCMKTEPTANKLKADSMKDLEVKQLNEKLLKNNPII